MDFKEKYLKYKNKYIALKNQTGSGPKFIEAIKKGDVELVRKKLTELHGFPNKHKSDPNQLDNLPGPDHNKSAIQIAIEKGNLDIVKLLLENGAKKESNLLYIARMYYNLDIIKLLLEHGVRSDSLCYDAVSRRNLDFVKLSLEYNKCNHEHLLNIEIGNLKHNSSLMRPINLDFLTSLLELGIIPSKSNIDTLIMPNSLDDIKKKLDILKLLFKYNIDLKEYSLERIIKINTRFSSSLFKELIDMGIIPNNNLLKIAIEIEKDSISDYRTNIIEIIKILLDHGVVPYEGLLKYLIINKKTYIISILLSHKVILTEEENKMLSEYKKKYKLIVRENYDIYKLYWINNYNDHIQEEYEAPSFFSADDIIEVENRSISEAQNDNVYQQLLINMIKASKGDIKAKKNMAIRTKNLRIRLRREDEEDREDEEHDEVLWGMLGNDGSNRSHGFPSLAQQIRQNSKGYGNYSPSSDGYDD